MKDKKLTLDPFATDFFGSGGASAVPARKVSRSKEGPAKPGIAFVRNWQRALPKVTLEQARLSAGLPQLPGALSLDGIARVLGRYTRISPDLVTLKRIEVREVDRADACFKRDERLVIAELSTGGNGTPVDVAVDTSFAAELVDRMLGGDGRMPDGLRDLSRVEHAVIEFLCLTLCHELNDALGVPILRLKRVSSAKASWFDAESDLRGPGNTGATRLVIATLHTSVGPVSGLVRIYCLPGFVTELNLALAKSIAPSGAVNRIETIAPDIPVAVVIGGTNISAGDINDLERGDVVVIGQPTVHWANGQIRGNVRARVGEGEHTFISGRLVESSDDGTGAQLVESQSLASGMKLRLETISAETPLTSPGKLTMEERLRAEVAPGDGAGVLDGLMVTVHVELASRRVRMAQLAQLRIGQIVELGCSATDPVDLVVDGRVIARGELVDIEGRLGVRITQPPG